MAVTRPKELVLSNPDTPMELLVASLHSMNANVATIRASGALTGEAAAALDELAESLDLSNRVAAGMEDYLVEVSTKPSAALQALEKASREQDWAGLHASGTTGFKLSETMVTGSLEGALLRSLVQVTHARQVLEVGMFTGYGTLAMAEVLPEGGKVTALELEPFLKEFSAPFFADGGCAGAIEVVVGPALDSMGELARSGASFELIFVDADKTGYLGYFHAAVGGAPGAAATAPLLAEGGLLAVDNTLLKAGVYATPEGERNESMAAVAAFNRAVAADPRVEQVVLPVRDGVSFVRWRKGAHAAAAAAAEAAAE